MSEKRKCRQYSIEYLKFGFIASPSNEQLPMCLECHQVFSNEGMKPSRMKEHLSRKHPDKKYKDFDYFLNLKKKLENRKTVVNLFKDSAIQLNKGLVTSYKISLLIAKCGKPHNIGEKLIIPAVQEILSNMTTLNPNSIISSIPLSNDTVSRRIDEMANDVEEQLCEDLQNTEFTLQLDESIVRNNEAILLAYVRYIKNDKIIEEMLFAKSLTTDTKGLSIFNVVKTFLDENNIPISNILACATDGAPAMIGRQRGFITLLKAENSKIFSIHCILHRQHLVAKRLSDRLHQSMNLVISLINKIKAHSLNDCLFRELCHDNDEEYERLLLHTEVRWLSKGNCLKRFFNLFDTIIEFLHTIKYEITFNVEVLRNDVAYLSDIYEKFNEFLTKMQGNNINLIKVKSSVTSFLNKLTLYKNNMARREFSLFSCLNTISAKNIGDTDLEIYCTHIENIKNDMNIRFKDVEQLIIPNWVIDPFNLDVNTLPSSIQEIMIDLQNDVEAKILYTQNNIECFWVNNRHKYKRLWNEIKLLIMAFPTSYLVEKGFNAIVQLLSKQRNRLQLTQKGDLRLLLTNFEPKINKLAQFH
ncbi:SCAN domain-containing protein 3-like [Centruroides sculpturatus]|uniref:SCAN domain-containing protein 3-like n=1 Tax=Centruroides sculpturatus TaxID=218467 RepID=UPI000C6DEA9A|nr:SCAN domain-containing protein 3-like [Centruroides sculpturatus]